MQLINYCDFIDSNTELQTIIKYNNEQVEDSGTWTVILCVLKETRFQSTEQEKRRLWKSRWVLGEFSIAERDKSQ